MVLGVHATAAPAYEGRHLLFEATKLLDGCHACRVLCHSERATGSALVHVTPVPQHVAATPAVNLPTRR